MIQSCVTVSLVEEARGGPFVFWDGLNDACQKAAELGFDAIEVYAPSREAIEGASLAEVLRRYGLSLAAVGTGAGWLRNRLTLTDQNPRIRAEAREFVRGMIDAAGPLGAFAVIGSIQGKSGDAAEHETAVGHLREALEELGACAANYGVPLVYEPLNRYETNLCNTVEQGVKLLDSLSTSNVKLLADLFHMSIEEVDLAAALRSGKHHVGHLHFVDSNRRAAGCGHINYAPIAAALRDMAYEGYASAEALPYPDSLTAARLTRETFQRHFS